MNWVTFVFSIVVCSIAGAVLLSFFSVGVANTIAAWYRQAFLKARAEASQWRQAAEYILSQEGDDLCWRDFYIELAKCLPHGHKLKDLARVRSIKPMPVMMRNCQNFCYSLIADKPYTRFDVDPLTVDRAALLPLSMIELCVRMHRQEGQVYNAFAWSTEELPGGYVSSPDVTIVAHRLLDAALAQHDGWERGLPLRPREDCRNDKNAAELDI